MGEGGGVCLGGCADTHEARHDLKIMKISLFGPPFPKKYNFYPRARPIKQQSKQPNRKRLRSLRPHHLRPHPILFRRHSPPRGMASSNVQSDQLLPLS